MSEQGEQSGVQPQRDQTDESLRLERDKADAGVTEKHNHVELEADEVVRAARERADHVLQTAREDVDRKHLLRSTTAEAITQRERARADLQLGEERSVADDALAHERAARQRFLADFLAVEREATDQHLEGERSQADTVIAARDEILATVSHDLRNLLGGLTLNAKLVIELASPGPGGDATRKQGAAIQRLVARMNRLVNDLLDITSIEAGKLAVVPEEVEVAKILGDLLEAFEPIAAAKHIRLDAQAESRPLVALLDGERILQVLANLVSNALKFTPAGGRVSIQVRTLGSELRFAVHDTGVGIPEDALQAVFERYRQVRADRRGLGLGLYISRCIVEAHGGEMWAESKLGAGSSFYFALPSSHEAP